MNLKKIILIFFVTFLYFPFVRAVPDKVIFSGCVRDTLTKELLEFATIQLKGKNTFSVLSDKNGNFKFSSVLPGEYVLQVSYLGYASQTISIKGKSVFAIRMSENDVQMDEVVVIGYGTVRKGELTGATASINEKMLKDIPVASAAEALTGRFMTISRYSCGLTAT